MKLIGDKHPRHLAALRLPVDKSGYGAKQLAAGRAWGVAVHESFDSVVAYVVEASARTAHQSCTALPPACTATLPSTPGASRRKCRVLRSWACRCVSRAPRSR